MKPNTMHTAAMLCFSVLLLLGTPSIRADDAAPVNQKTASGTVKALDAKEKVVKIQGVFLSKIFVLGENCSLMLANQKAGSLADFQPGQKVTVTYQDIDGVLVASQIVEQRLAFTGRISAVAPANHSLTVESGSAVRVFKLPDDCTVVLSGDTKGAFDNLEPGNRVTVIYETPNGQWTARRIELPSLQFSGSLTALNVADRTITAGKKLIPDKQFHLAADCVVVNNGSISGRLQDLHIGQNYQFSYTTVNGVNIVNRIGPPPSAQPARNGSQSANLDGSSPAY